MQIVILCGFILAMSLQGVPAASAPGGQVALMVGAYLLMACAITGLSTLAALRRLRCNSTASPRSAKVQDLIGMLSHFYLLAGLGAILLLGFGPWVDDFVQTRHMANVPLVHEAMLLAPFVAALMLTWLLEYPLHRTMRLRQSAARAMAGVRQTPVWTLWQYVLYNLRHNLLFIAVPVGLILLLNDLVASFGLGALERWGIGPEAATIAQGIISAAAAGLVFLIAPVLIVRIWQTRPLEAGELRSYLEQTLRRLRLRCRDIRVWQTGGVIANAGVMGLLPPVRYVLLTDSLLDNMGRPHLQAIFAHEVGHITSHHIFYSVLFSLVTIIWASLPAQVLCDLGMLGQWQSQILALSLLGVLWWWQFGLLSRKFERQSDIIGAWTAGEPFNTGPDKDLITPEGAAIFATALRQVAYLNGTALDQPNWRHGTIAQRVNHVIYLGSTGQGRRTIDRAVRRIKIALWVLLALGIAALVLEYYFVGYAHGIAA